MSFETFIGNRTVVDRLRTKLRENRFPHALIFSGPEGVGKRTCALMIAKALNCAQLGPNDFCGACAQCRKIDAGTHSDVSFVTVEEEASEIKIAQIRHISQMLELKPLEGANKVFIIDPATAMKGASTNALLKGLEEPPDNSFFILLTANVHELLMTVRSRCQIYHFAPLTLSDVRQHGVTDELLVRWSQGSIGRARSLDAVTLKEQREMVMEFLETALRATESEFREMLGASADLSRSKNDFGGYLVVLMVLIADLLYLKSGATDQVVNIDIRPRLEKLSEIVSIERLVALGDFLRFIENSLKNYVNRQMLTDVLALTASETAEKILDDNPTKSR